MLLSGLVRRALVVGLLRDSRTSQLPVERKLKPGGARTTENRAIPSFPPTSYKEVIQCEGNGRCARGMQATAATSAPVS